MTLADVALIRSIRNSANISAVAPKLLGAIDVSGVRLLMVGVDLPSELAMKSWWVVDGAVPAARTEVLLGHRAEALRFI